MLNFTGRGLRSNLSQDPIMLELVILWPCPCRPEAYGIQFKTNLFVILPYRLGKGISKEIYT